MIDKFLSLMFLVAPLFYITRMPLRKAEAIFFVLFTAGLWLVSKSQSPQRTLTYHIVPFIILIFVALAQIIVYDFSPTTSACFTNIFLGVLGCFIIAEYSDGLNLPMQRMIVSAGIINIIVVIIQNLGYSPVIVTTHTQFGGFMGNAPRLGDYLALTFPLACCYSWLAGVLWLLTGLYIHQFPMFMVAAVFFICFEYQAHKDGLRASWIGVVPFVLIGFIIWQHQHILNSLTIRFAQWQPIVDQIFQHPIFGLGAGTYPIFANNYDEVAMSSLIEFIFNFGLVGGGIILYFFIKSFVINFRCTPIQVSIIGLGVLSVVEYPFEIQRLWPFITALGGFYLIEKHRRTQ